MLAQPKSDSANETHCRSLSSETSTCAAAGLFTPAPSAGKSLPTVPFSFFYFFFKNQLLWSVPNSSFPATCAGAGFLHLRGQPAGSGEAVIDRLCLCSRGSFRACPLLRPAGKNGGREGETRARTLAAATRCLCLKPSVFPCWLAEVMFRIHGV